MPPAALIIIAIASWGLPFIGPMVTIFTKNKWPRPTMRLSLTLGCIGWVIGTSVMFIISFTVIRLLAGDATVATQGFDTFIRTNQVAINVSLIGAGLWLLFGFENTTRQKS